MDKLSVKKYFDYLYAQDVIDILRMRDMDKQLVYTLPEITHVVVTEDYKLVALGGLRKVEGNYAFMDSFLSNPVFSGNIRDKALNLLTETLIKEAHSQGYDKLLTFTLDENTINRSHGHGFKPVPFACSVLDLKRDEG